MKIILDEVPLDVRYLVRIWIWADRVEFFTLGVIATILAVIVIALIS